MTLADVAERRTRWLGALAVFLFVMTPLVGYLIPLWFAGAISVVGLLGAPSLVRPRPPLLPVFALLLMVLWSVISLRWSPATPPMVELKSGKALEKFTAVKLVLELGLYSAAVAALGAMSVRSARRAGRVMLVGMALLAQVACADAVLRAKLYMSLHRATGEGIRPDLALVKVSLATYPLALLFWPCARLLDDWGFRGRNLAVAALALLTIVAAHLTGADAPIAALLAGGLVWLGARFVGKPVVRTLIPLVSAVFIFTPVITLWAVRSGVIAWLHVLAPPSWDARLNIWAFASEQIVRHPLRGWGIDASRTFGPAIPLHTHNAALQLWLELGAFGAAMAAAFFAWMLYRIVGLTGENRRDGAMAAAALTTYLIIGGISFGVWQEWWLALGALTVIACGVAQKSSAAHR